MYIVFLSSRSFTLQFLIKNKELDSYFHNHGVFKSLTPASFIIAYYALINVSHILNANIFE